MMGMPVLHITPLLQARVVLLKGIAADGIVQKKREIRIQVEERPIHKAVCLERVTIRPRFAVVTRNRSEFYSSAIRRIDVAEPVENATANEVKRNLARRIKLIPPENKSESEFLGIAQRLRVVRVHVVAPIPPGILEWTIGIRCFISHIRIHAARRGTPRQK